MGVSIIAKNSTYDFDMGYFGFARLRQEIAKAFDKEFGEMYGEYMYCYDPEDFIRVDEKINDYLAEHNLDAEVLDFLYQSDTGGSISYSTCGKIYKFIKDIDFGEKSFRYGAQVHNDYEEFKEFLKECYQKHKKMRWY